MSGIPMQLPRMCARTLPHDKQQRISVSFQRSPPYRWIVQREPLSRHCVCELDRELFLCGVQGQWCRRVGALEEKLLLVSDGSPPACLLLFEWVPPVGVVGACGVAPCPVRVLGLGAPVLWGGCGQRRRRMWCGCRCRRGERNRWGRWVVWADAVMECRMNSYISLRFSIHKEDTAGRDPLLPREKKGVVAVRVLSPLRR